jgi:hypothetical protein
MNGGSQVTAVMLTIGEPTFERARQSVLRQTYPVADIVVVDDVRPFHRAINTGAARVRTPYFIQVDSDMILDADCVENLVSRFESYVGSVVCHLRDPLYGRVEAIKMYRTSCFKDAGLPDSISPDTDFHDGMRRDGWLTIYALRFHDREPGVWHTFGEHRPEYTQFFAYARNALNGRRWRYRGNAAALRDHLRVVHESQHPAALISHIGLARGLFLPGEQDLLSRYEPDADYERIAALLARERRPGDRRLRFAWRPPVVSAKQAFRRYYERGICIARDGCRSDIEDELARLHATVHPWAWLMQAALCQGLFVDRFDRATFEHDWSCLSVFSYYYEPFNVARRITTELRRRAAAARMRVTARS